MMSSIGSSQASNWANSLFTKLDTKNQGYLEKSDLQSAFSKISSSSGSASVDDVFSQLDGNQDGKVTQDEMSSAIQQLSDQLDSQFNTSRMQGGGAHEGGGGKPPPPPPPEGADSAGFTKDELTSQLAQIGSSDSQRSDLISKIVENFDKADANGDGKVSMTEAMAYDKSTQSSSSSSTSSASSDSSSSSGSSATTDSQRTELQVLMKVMQLMQAYKVTGDDSQTSSSLFSTSA